MWMDYLGVYSFLYWSISPSSGISSIDSTKTKTYFNNLLNKKCMELISWNVNGIRAALKKGFMGFLKEHEPNILCLQETKASKEQVQEVFPTYHQYWNSADKKGYSGTLLLSKTKPLNVSNDFEGHSGEGRVITAEYEQFILVNVYVPNSKRGLLRLDYRMQWDKDFLTYLKELEQKKPVIICGDLNVAHKEIDLKNPRSNRRNPGFTDEERKGFTKFIDAGFLDSFREFEKGEGHYTWWSYMFNAREKNVGWRIDYFLVSKQIKEKLKSATILKDVMGSDHCPVGITLEL